MKLLFDENLSPRLVEHLEADFPGSSHIELVGMRGSTDVGIWGYARENGFTIVSKDNDFRQRMFLYGAGGVVIADLIASNRDRIVVGWAKRSVPIIKIGSAGFSPWRLGCRM